MNLDSALLTAPRVPSHKFESGRYEPSITTLWISTDSGQRVLVPGVKVIGWCPSNLLFMRPRPEGVAALFETEEGEERWNHAGHEDSYRIPGFQDHQFKRSFTFELGNDCASQSSDRETIDTSRAQIQGVADLFPWLQEHYPHLFEDAERGLRAHDDMTLALAYKEWRNRDLKDRDSDDYLHLWSVNEQECR